MGHACHDEPAPNACLDLRRKSVPGIVHAVLAFGGFKQSGIGRENGPESFEGFLETKSVWINYD